MRVTSVHQQKEVTKKCRSKALFRKNRAPQGEDGLNAAGLKTESMPFSLIGARFFYGIEMGAWKYLYNDKGGLTANT